MCAGWMRSLPARSTIVRASLNTRWYARAAQVHRPAAPLHGRAEELAAGLVHRAVVAHLGGSHPGRQGVSALVVRPAPWPSFTLANRADCRAHAASTRARIAADGSPRRSSLSFWKGTRGTSTWMSIRSSSGPESRFW